RPVRARRARGALCPSGDRDDGVRRALNWQLIAGLALIVAWLLIGFGAPFFTGVSPLKERTFVQLGTRSIPAPFEPGTFGYPLGSDRQGRDLWVTVMYGAQATFTLAFVVLAARLVIGVTLGAVAGWFAGRWIDRLVSALVAAFAAFPPLVVPVLSTVESGTLPRLRGLPPAVPC